MFNRWQEHWSALANPKLRTEPLDSLKYIPISDIDSQSYVSLGGNLRERFETVDASQFGVKGVKGDSYLIQRLELHADLHPNEHWQVFVQVEDDRAFGKTNVSSADADKLDLEQGFAAYQVDFAGGTLKLRGGRQEFAFDLQRFVAARDGANVRQAFDAAWADWERGNWRMIGFWSEPVQYYDAQPFDDRSNGHLQFGGLRLEDNAVGPGKLSIYYARYQHDDVSLLDAAGNERRNVLDIRYAGASQGFDWDLEAMGQDGSVGAAPVLAWAIGTRSGYTFEAPWRPRLGLQFDAASGDHHPGNGTVQTFNPLFPNGYYVTLAGFTGFANFVHVKPSIIITPVSTLVMMLAMGLQWRESTADAVYTQPNIPVPGTAGEGGSWTGYYEQFRVDYAISANVAAALEAVHFNAGSAIRRAGGHDANYAGAQLQLGW